MKKIQDIIKRSRLYSKSLRHLVKSYKNLKTQEKIITLPSHIIKKRQDFTQNHYDTYSKHIKTQKIMYINQSHNQKIKTLLKIIYITQSKHRKKIKINHIKSIINHIKSIKNPRLYSKYYDTQSNYMKNPRLYSNITTPRQII